MSVPAKFTLLKSDHVIQNVDSKLSVHY